MNTSALLLTVLFSSTTLIPQIRNDDRPKLGVWDLKPEKVWEIKRAGENEFGRIAELLKTGHNRLVVRDFERNVSYVFDDNGRCLGSFAKQGAAEGELSRYLNRFPAERKIVLATPEHLHFYSDDGVFLTSSENNIFARFPLVSLNEHSFI